MDNGKRSIGERVMTAVVVTAAFSASGLLGSNYPIIVLIGWGLFYHMQWADGARIAADYAAGHFPQPTELYRIPGPLSIWDGPVGQAYHPDIEMLLFMLFIIGSVGWIIGQARWMLGLCIVWGPLLFLPAWQFHVGKAKFYPKGEQGYFMDHYSQICAKGANGNIMTYSNGTQQCTIQLVKTPPF